MDRAPVSAARTHRLRQATGIATVPLLALSFAGVMRYASPAYRDDPQRETTRAAAHSLVQALATFRTRHARVPSAREGLSRLIPDNPSALPVDAWGRPFVYAPSHDRLWADVVSYGADGRPGGSGSAADISGRFGALDGKTARWPATLASLFFFVSVTAAGIFAGRSAWAAGILTGGAGLCGLLLAALISGTQPLSLIEAAAWLLALTCLAAGAAVPRKLPGAVPLAVATTLVTGAVLGQLMA